MQVRVFRNLTRAAWSIQARTQGAWRTIGHASAASIDDAAFYVSEASRLRCAAKGQREVHAWIQGELANVVACKLVAKWANDEIAAAVSAATTDCIPDLPRGVTYRPFVESGFRVRATGELVTVAPHAVCAIRCAID